MLLKKKNRPFNYVFSESVVIISEDYLLHFSSCFNAFLSHAHQSVCLSAHLAHTTVWQKQQQIKTIFTPRSYPNYFSFL